MINSKIPTFSQKLLQQVCIAPPSLKLPIHTYERSSGTIHSHTYATPLANPTCLQQKQVVHPTGKKTENKSWLYYIPLLPASQIKKM